MSHIGSEVPYHNESMSDYDMPTRSGRTVCNAEDWFIGGLITRVVDEHIL